jgi:hypothetical protein
MTLVLVGSSISVMEEKVLSGSASLYGRWTATIDLKPLLAGNARQFFPKYDAETKIMVWAIYGGIPHYLQTIDLTQSVATNVQQTVLSERGLLYSEPEFSLRMELRQPNTYFSIFRALAQGRRTPNEIAGMAGIESGSLSTYLQRLCRHRLVERHIPATESPTASKRGRYRIAAPLFRFVYGNQDQLHRLGGDAYNELVARCKTSNAASFHIAQSVVAKWSRQHRAAGGAPLTEITGCVRSSHESVHGASGSTLRYDKCSLMPSITTVSWHLHMSVISSI